MYPLSWHFDFHSHKNIRINHRPAVADMACTLVECGVEEIITFAKCHNGFAYYPTRWGTVHPRMAGDAFGDVVWACKRAGVRVLAYVSFGIDGEAGRKHPEWVQVAAEPKPVSEDWFVPVCPFTSYLDGLMLPMIAEILDTYPVDGLFFDTMGAMGACYCEACRKEFQAAHGREIPRRPEDDGWAVYGQFRHRRAAAMIRRLGQFISERKPDAKVGFNHVGTYALPEKMPPGISCLTLDFATATPQSRQASLCAAYGSTADLPADVMNTIFNQGWGDWSPRPMASLEQTAVAIWARKCRPYIGDRLHPENRLDPITTRAMRFLADVARRVRAAYPAEDSKLVPDALLLHGPFQMYGPDFRDFWKHGFGLARLRGAHNLLLDAGANFAITAEAFLDKNLDGCKLVIVPEMPALTPESEPVLRRYVEAGGRVLVAGAIPTINEKPLGWLGVARGEKPWQDHIYLPAWSADESPVLIRGDFYPLALGRAQAVLPAIRPYDCDHGVRFGWGIAPPSSEPAVHAALTKTPLGKGEVWYLEAPIFTDYDNHGNWTQVAWFRQLLSRLIPRPALRVVSAAGTVEAVAHRNPRSTWAFLINHGGEQLCGERRWARTFLPVPPFPITLELRDDAGRKPKTVTVDGKAIDGILAHGAVTISLTMDSIWKVLRVDWE